jgi:four helix bundle protein
MQMSGSYRDLKAWQKSMELVAEIYLHTRKFPKDEQFGLAMQLRRAAVSVPSNIAEGKGRSSDKEFNLFLHHARGSLFEVETQLAIAHRLGHLGEPDASQLMRQAGELARMLNGLIHSLKAGKVVGSAA